MKPIALILSLLLFSSFCLSSNAQFSDSVHHWAKFQSTGSFNRTGDGVTYLFNNAAQYRLRKKSAELNTAAAYLYGQTPEKLTNNDLNLSLDGNLYKTFPHFYYWGLLNFNSSYSLKVNGQFQAGAGAAYRVIDKEKTVFSISNGWLFEHSDVLAATDSTVRYQTVRNSLRLQFRTTYKDFLKVGSVVYYQQSLLLASDYLLTAKANLDFKLWKWASLTTALAYTRISRTERENLLFTYGLVFEGFF